MQVVYLASFLQTLQNILGGIFDAILAPVLRDVFNVLVRTIGILIQEILSGFLLKIWIIFLKLIDFLEQVFDIFSGVSPVEVKIQDVSKKMSLLEYFFQLNEIKTAFMIITVIAVAIAFLATIYAVMKSISDMTFDEKKPISHVLKQALKSAVTFLLVPFACLFALHMASTVTKIFNSSINYQMENQRVSDILFITVAEEGVKNITDGTAKDAVIKEFSSGQKYQDAELVKEKFDIQKFSYIQAYSSTFLMALIMLVSILQFIQRIFAILVLYVVSPFFVAMMPLDEGAKFKRWREMFVSHMVSAFGPILSMKLYFMIIPLAVSNDIQYPVQGSVLSAVHLLFIIGGAYAVYKSRLLFIQILDPGSAGMMEASGFLGAMIGSKLASKLMPNPKKVIGKTKIPPKESSDDAGKKNDNDQAYTGK